MSRPAKCRLDRLWLELCPRLIICSIIHWCVAHNCFHAKTRRTVAWTVVNKCSCNLVPPNSIRTMLLQTMFQWQFMVMEIACSELLTSMYFAMKMPTQIPGRKWPLSYTDMFLDRTEQVVNCSWSLNRQINLMLQLITFVNTHYAKQHPVISDHFGLDLTSCPANNFALFSAL